MTGPIRWTCWKFTWDDRAFLVVMRKQAQARENREQRRKAARDQVFVFLIAFAVGSVIMLLVRNFIG